MLKIKTLLGVSGIHGFGLFAAQHVPAGTEVWQFTAGFDLEIDPLLLDSQPEIARLALLHYGYIDQRLGRFILCCDNARFINHSDHPNIATREDGLDVAVREIEPGEEITIDYGLLEGSRPSASATLP